MVTIHPGASEREAGHLSAEHLALALRAVREDGCVVLEDVIDPRHIEVLRDKMLADVETYLHRSDAPFNWNKGNMQQDPPPTPPYLFRDVLANDFVIDITHALMGDGIFNAFYSGNTALPSESRQPVHADIGHLWPNLNEGHPPYAIVVNVPVVDMGPENGSTELWPGTHRDPAVCIQDGFIEIPESKLEAWRENSPPFQPQVRAGSILVRDIRMWHAGMPNRTQQPRPMIAMIHYVSWWNSAPIRLHREAQALLEHPRLRQHAEYFEGEVDYVGATGGYKSDEA